jgi:flagellar biosynthesis/type III secretory pathway protein FliH
MTTEKMTDEEWAEQKRKDLIKAAPQQGAYHLYAEGILLGLAEGRKRCAEESKAVIAGLERKLAMRRNHVCGPNTQSGEDEIDLITGKTEGREK